MGLLSLSKERFRLGRLRKSLEKEPLPHGIAECVLGYLTLGDHAAAQQVLEFGCSVFPDSQEIRRLQTRMTSVDGERRVRDAKERVRSAPSMQAYLGLADAYRTLQRDDACAATLEEAIRRFGEQCSALVQLGAMRFERYRDSLKASDAIAAKSWLERAAAADADAVKPHYLLAELLALVGAHGQARACLERTLALAPEHDRARRLLRELDHDKSEASTDEGNDFETLVAQVEIARSFGDGGIAGRGDDGSITMPLQAPTAEVARLRESTGASCVVFGAQSRPSVEAHDLVTECADGLRERSVVMRDLADLCDRAARGMDLGAPARLVVEGADSTCILELKRGAFMGVLVGTEHDVEGSAVATRDALERVVRA
jgi:tetratricopeptide (TPR) repeat protein